MRIGRLVLLAAVVATIGLVPRLAAASQTGADRSRPLRHLAFVPDDPLVVKQWYVSADRAFDEWAALAAPPLLPPVKVAVIDSGVDGSHPDLAGKIVASRSFVGGSALTDEDGHGTFVAGEIAAGLDNGVGIAGIAFPAQLVVAKVVGTDGTIAPAAEAAAIFWAVGEGARVLNLSLGGLRDPRDPGRDTYSQLEANAIGYAIGKGAVVVAAVGNGDQAPTAPWPYASYPAALPHVIGVSAYAQDGSVPTFSNRDALFNDLAAPGVGILSTAPLALTEQRPSCPDQGYSDCAGSDLQAGQGTSFAAPQVSAAAALLLSLHPDLTPDQVSWVLERSADDISPATGCATCTPGRDPVSGWGRLDIANALQLANTTLPPPDRFEPNNDAAQAQPLDQNNTTLQATVDYWDNPVDVYRIRLRHGQWVAADLRAAPALHLRLSLWKPGTPTVTSRRNSPFRAAQSTQHGTRANLLQQATATGWWYLEIEATSPTPGSGAYQLHVSASRQ